MSKTDEQRMLAQDQIEAFYHDNFVKDQIRDFVELVPLQRSDVVVDVGGGCGYFAKALSEQTGAQVRVLDTDPKSVVVCNSKGVDARVNDALQPEIIGDERIVCFNLILHHLVGASERDTSQLQRRAIGVWKEHARAVFVNEYVYESFLLRGASAAIIYAITRSRLLSTAAGIISLIAPSLKANTFGVGVRFRSSEDWRNMFSELGFEIVGVRMGDEEEVSIPRRMLLIKSCRRDSFVLVPRSIA